MEDGEDSQEGISRFIKLYLSLILRRIDQMEMKKRIELINLFGSIIIGWIDKLINKVNTLEKRIQELED
jgi:hypothetical protein